ncbi:MAG: hypothetical protein Q8P35_00995 [Candidatus Yanofskybacteria bacterium]|nr:hypothetical protein [Candidatus Yanofskybacteria bacterium]
MSRLFEELTVGDYQIIAAVVMYVIFWNIWTRWQLLKSVWWRAKRFFRSFRRPQQANQFLSRPRI